MVRSCCVLYILTSKCASRHNGVKFFISHLAKWLRIRRFSERTFRPSGATNHWKNKLFRDFPTFSRICVFFLLTLSLLWSSLFYSSVFSDSSSIYFFVGAGRCWAVRLGKVHPVAGRCRLLACAGGRKRCAARPVPVAGRCRSGNLTN